MSIWRKIKLIRINKLEKKIYEDSIKRIRTLLKNEGQILDTENIEVADIILSKSVEVFL